MSKRTAARIRCAVFLVLISFGLTAIDAAQSQDLVQDEAKRAYQEIVSSQGKVFKWTHDLKIVALTQGKVNSEYISPVLNILQAAGPALPIAVNRSTGKTDILIIFVTDPEKAVSELDKALRGVTASDKEYQVLREETKKARGGCINARGFDGVAPEYFLLLVFPNGQAGNESYWRNCLARSLFGNLGLGSGSTKAYSIFNPSLDLEMPTDVDIAMLSRFYSAKIASGMSTEQALRTFIGTAN